MTRAVRMIVAVAALVAAASVGVADAPLANAAGDSTAVVVIDTGATVRSAVIHFDGSVSGIQALELAGANPVTYGFAGQGAAVCALDGVGNPADQSCLVGPNSEYWAYHRAAGGATTWSYSRGCACTTTVRDGDVEGWRYGTGAAPRSAASFCAYVACPPPPTVPPGGGTAGGGESGGGTGGGTGAAPGGAGAGPGGGSSSRDPTIGGAAPGNAGTTDPAATDAAPSPPAESDTTTTRPATTTRPRDRGDVRVAGARAARLGGGDEGAGSPAGVVAAGALVATGGTAIWLRRRRHALR